MFRFIHLAFLFLSVSALAEDKPTLLVYTYSSFISEWGPGREIKTLFEAECHCRVKYAAFGDGVTILNRLKLEGKTTRADVIVGLDSDLIGAANQAGLVQPHRLKPFKAMQLNWWDDNFIPYDYGYLAFIYNKNKIVRPPTSLHELISSDHNWKIVYQDPRTSTPGLGLVLWVQSVYGNNATEAWKQLAKKTITVTKGWSEAYSLMLKNEADFALSYDTSPVAHITNQANFDYKAASFDEGHYLQIEVAGITKNSQQVPLAQQFLRFLAKPNIQHLVAVKNVMHSIIKIPSPQGFDKLIQVKKSLMLPAEIIETNRQQWVATWLNATSH